MFLFYHHGLGSHVYCWRWFCRFALVDSKFAYFIIITIIIITLLITFIQHIYNYIPETNRVSTVYSAAAVLYLQSALHVMLFRP